MPAFPPLVEAKRTSVSECERRDLCGRALAAWLRRRGPPDQEAALDHRHQGVDHEHEHREHDHPGKHARDVEIAFRRLDQVAEPGSGAEIFAHHGADHPLSISS